MGKRITWLREQAKLSPAELARRIGIAQPSLWAIESGKTKTLKAETLQALVVQLRTTSQLILYGEEGVTPLELATMEAELTFTVRTLSPERRIALMEYARYLVAQQPGAQAVKDNPANVSHLRKPPRSTK